MLAERHVQNSLEQRCWATTQATLPSGEAHAPAGSDARPG